MITLARHRPSKGHGQHMDMQTNQACLLCLPFDMTDLNGVHTVAAGGAGGRDRHDARRPRVVALRLRQPPIALGYSGICHPGRCAGACTAPPGSEHEIRDVVV